MIPAQGPIVVTLEDWLEPILPRYLEIREREQEALQRAVERGDMDEAGLIGHRTKGSGASFGLPEVTEIGRGIEMAAKAGDSEQVRKLVDRLGDYMARLEVRFEGGGKA
ncbi:Hpt domain-containing protein [Salidesulfovibrio brasiliensis]|uniref:Hpt domain-containing protein n=1 Tax=Salidesulfovibrio brasiliensis TaxID=221711 RepID=UPI0006D07D60|nr:Hpt domain-containing protein [Salidesulfovibrio brasiliensis]